MRQLLCVSYLVFALIISTTPSFADKNEAGFMANCVGELKRSPTKCECRWEEFAHRTASKEKYLTALQASYDKSKANFDQKLSVAEGQISIDANIPDGMVNQVCSLHAETRALRESVPLAERTVEHNKKVYVKALSVDKKIHNLLHKHKVSKANYYALGNYDSYCSPIYELKKMIEERPVKIAEITEKYKSRTQAEIDAALNAQNGYSAVFGASTHACRHVK